MVSSILFCNFAPKLQIMGERLVSVIMPSYNGAKHLAASIDSILGQTYKNLELLITDDHSDDEQTLNILKRFCEQDSRVNVLYLDSNHGPGYARNKSIERAKGRYIAFCDSDDRWAPDKLERQIAFMDEKHTALSYTSYIICDDDDEEEDFMPSIRKRQDWGLFLSILRDCHTAHAIKEPMAYYRNRQNSVSSNKLGLIKYNILIYQKVLGFSKLKSHLYFFCLFTPTHLIKILKRSIDSLIYKIRK